MTEPFRITKPGIYPEIALADFFADPAPTPSLTQSIAKVLIDRSPLHGWFKHPRLNPDYQSDDDTKYDVGNIAHKLMIGRGKDIVVLDDFDDWRTKEARTKREEAAADGKLAILGKHFTLADRMVTAAREQLELRGLSNLFRDGDGEVCVAWKEGDIWLRQLIDWLTPDRRIFADYKSTRESAAPHALARKMVNDGWDIQGAMGERGLNAVDPNNAGRRRYLFVVQEVDEPYCLNVVELSEAVLTMGRKRLQIGVDIWTRCVEVNGWPGYPLEIVTPEYPGYMEAQWLEREVQHAERNGGVPSDILMGG